MASYVATCRKCHKWYSVWYKGEDYQEMVCKALCVLGWLFIGEHWFCPKCEPAIRGPHAVSARRQRYAFIPPTVEIQYES